LPPAFIVPPTGEAEAVVSRAELTALKPVTPAADSLKTKQILRNNQKSVVGFGYLYCSGSGVVVGDGGLVVTAAEVLATHGKRGWVYVVEAEGAGHYTKAENVELLRVDNVLNLALVRVKTAQQLTAVTLAANAPAPGSAVVSMGPTSPESGYEALAGTLSAAERNAFGIRAIQLDMHLTMESTGRPLFDDHGQLLGLLWRNTTNESTSLAIPASDIRKFLEDCSRERAATRPAAPRPPVAPKR
jgi:S1-C subfamily serine protease